MDEILANCVLLLFAGHETTTLSIANTALLLLLDREYLARVRSGTAVLAAAVEESLRCQTLHGAHASFEEREKGSIERGKLADLVVLGRDPLRTDPMQLVNIPIERTMVGGRWVYES